MGETIFVTGGAGFIGSHFCRETLAAYPDDEVVCFDKLTYAGNPDNLRDLQGEPRFRFVQGDICDAAAVEAAMAGATVAVNFAAETHVDRSLMDAAPFVQTNTLGPYILLQACRKLGVRRYLQVSTDEVYGPIPKGEATEEWPLRPANPYSASKASGELMVLATARSFGLDVVVTRGVNTIGPYQFPEKAIPLFVTNALDGEPLPLYGDGGQVRDRLPVRDHARAIDCALRCGKSGEVYNVSAGFEQTNLQVARDILRRLGKPETLIRFVTDRAGHDIRYALDSRKLRALGWAPMESYESALDEIVQWYAENEWWWRRIKSGEWRRYYEAQYAARLAEGAGETGR
jgi:dTDP-glucose 4,6-dehydratase